MMNAPEALTSSGQIWDQEILPALDRYIRIPNKSPAYDPGWRAAGHMDRAVALIEQWCRAQPIPGLTVEVVRIGERTPVILMEIPGSGADTVLLYGHLDKQPEMTGWREGLSPWEPVREGDKLFGRGGADDGYSSFASLAALRLLHQQSVKHARCVVLIEACEESGSTDLPAYIEMLAPRIGKPSLVVCLDSGCGNYDQLWMTTSLTLLRQLVRLRVLSR
jgi:acetylornithine deacetylase/succinyl-diaminopimelate desuccinylase-like protein